MPVVLGAVALFTLIGFLSRSRSHPTAPCDRDALAPTEPTLMEPVFLMTWAHVPFEDLPELSKERPVVLLEFQGDAALALPLFRKPRRRRADYFLPVDEPTAHAIDHHGRPSFIRITRPVRIPVTNFTKPTESWVQASPALSRRLQGALVEWQVAPWRRGAPTS